MTDLKIHAFHFFLAFPHTPHKPSPSSSPEPPDRPLRSRRARVARQLSAPIPSHPSSPSVSRWSESDTGSSIYQTPPTPLSLSPVGSPAQPITSPATDSPKSMPLDPLDPNRPWSDNELPVDRYLAALGGRLSQESPLHSPLSSPLSPETPGCFSDQLLSPGDALDGPRGSWDEGRGGSVRRRERTT